MVSDFTVSGDLHENEDLVFDASLSSGTGLAYSWKLGDDNVLYGPIQSKQFFDSDTYVIELTVSDGVRSHTSTQNLVIGENSDPVATFEASTDLYANETISFDASLSGGPITSIRWDFDDGTIVEGSYDTFQQVNHTFDQEREYNVTLTVSTADLRQSAHTETLDVSYRDTDLDGMPDFWEQLHSFNMNDPKDASIDTDNDQLTNLEEYLYSSNPRDDSSEDLDSIPDDWERYVGLDTTPEADDSSDDEEPDGLSNEDEYLLNTNPFSSDTDGDGLHDLSDSVSPQDPLKRDHPAADLILF